MVANRKFVIGGLSVALLTSMLAIFAADWDHPSLSKASRSVVDTETDIRQSIAVANDSRIAMLERQLDGLTKLVEDLVRTIERDQWRVTGGSAAEKNRSQAETTSGFSANEDLNRQDVESASALFLQISPSPNENNFKAIERFVLGLDSGDHWGTSAENTVR